MNGPLTRDLRVLLTGLRLVFGAARGTQAVCCLLSVVALPLACTSAPAVEVRAAAVVTHQEPEKPELGLIEREGDPMAAMAVAVFTRANAAVNARLARAARDELSRAGYEPTSRSADNALLLSIALTNAKSATEATEHLRHALLDAPLGSAAALAFQPPDPCGFATTALSAEQVRAELGQRNSRLILIGTGELLERAVKGYETAPAWPKGIAAEDPWPAQDQFLSWPAVDGTVLSIALRTPDTARALNAAPRLAASGSTLQLLAQTLTPGWQVARVHTTLRPNGACLSAELWARGRGNIGLGPTTRAMAAEMASVLKRSEPSPGPLRAVDAADPRDAALSAAWAALAMPGAEGHEQWVLARGGSGQSQLLQNAFSSATPPSLNVHHRQERGQGRVWALLSSACSTEHEDRESAGHTFATLVAAARLAGREHPFGVSVEPWLNGSQLGLIASAPSGADAARVIAEAMGRALLGVARAESELAAARDLVLDSQPASLGWTTALELLSGGSPSRLSPTGYGASLQRFSGATAGRALRGFAGHPLELAISGNANEAQAAALQAHLARLLWPLRGAVEHCAPPPPSDARAGEYDVGATPAPLPAQETPVNAAVGSDEVVESWLGFTTRKESWSAVYWTALWLNGADGWLARSVASATVLTRAEAFALGGPNARGALVIRIQAPASAMSNAIAQARALLGQLPSSPTAGLPGVERLARSDRGRARRDPRVRLAELIWASPPPPSTSAIRELLLGELAPTRAIVVRSAAPLSGGG